MVLSRKDSTKEMVESLKRSGFSTTEAKDYIKSFTAQNKVEELLNLIRRLAH
jgi:Holliday junction resolvasome RuvABC DNA-binding subunit